MAERESPLHRGGSSAGVRDEQYGGHHDEDGEEDDDGTYVTSSSAAGADDGNAWTGVAVETPVMVMMMASGPAVVVATEPAVMASDVSAAVV